MTGHRAYIRLALLLLGLFAVGVTGTNAASRSRGSGPADPAVVTLYPVASPHGLMVTSGGWAYCEQVRALARRNGYTLLCGRYREDGYLGYGLLSQRRLDWGNPGYLASLAVKIRAAHKRVGGELVLVGVSYSGFGVATLASHHPEIRPDRLIVIDSFLDLVERRAALPATHNTARDIDRETGGSVAALQSRSVSVAGLARLVDTGTRLTVIWTTAPSEQRVFNGATCNAASNAALLLELANTLGKPAIGWVTNSEHGHDLWDHGHALMQGRGVGTRIVFRPGGSIPPTAVCS